MSSRVVELSGVGAVVLERSIRAKHLRLTVRPFKGARVAVPQGVSFERAAAFVRAKQAWLQKQMGKARQMEAFNERRMAVATPISDRRARRILIERLEVLSRRYQLPYRRVFIRRQQTRWGSCSGRNNISLNIQLAYLPPLLMDYVLVHELMHTRIKNHGQDFWRALDAVFGDARSLDRRLSSYTIAAPAPKTP